MLFRSSACLFSVSEPPVQNSPLDWSSREAVKDGVGRQKRICNLPFFPIEIMEKAVVKHYALAVQIPQQLRDDLRRSIDTAVAENFQLTDTMRAEFAKRLEALDKRENYYLDLAAEEGWPKDKLRDKINAIRAESQDIRLHLAQAEQKLDRGKQTFYCALDLMENPEAMYRRSDEAVRSILNKAFFTKLYVDGGKAADGYISGQDFKEPFNDVLDQAYEVWRTRRDPHGRTYARPAATQTLSSAILTTEDGAAVDHFGLVASLVPRQGRGLSKTVMVDLLTALANPRYEVQRLLAMADDWRSD